MTDFASAIRTAEDLSTEEQKKTGMPTAGTLDQEHLGFLKTVKELVARKEIDFYNPQTFLKRDVYDALSDEWKEKTDIALINLATLLKYVYGFYASKETPDESPMYETMIDQLWQIKQGIEQEHDVFKF